MQKEDINIRRIQLNDLSGAIRLSTEQGWNQTERDWKMIIENPQNSCLLAEYHGKIIGTTAAMNYSNKVAWITMVLVDKEFRGHGISKSLLEIVLKELQHCKSIKLDATPEGQPVYKQFNFSDEYLISRMTIDSIKNLSFHNDELLPEPIQLKNLPAIIAYDEQVFGANRAQLIESLVKEYPHKAWMINRNHAIVGYVLGRIGRKYQQIGPVMATSYDDAKILMKLSLHESEGKPTVVDVLNDKENLMNLLKSFGFAHQRHFVRMYRGHNPFPGNIEKHYLICGPEFG